MFKNQYFCFIAGLPDLVFEDSKFSATLQEFKQELRHELASEDYELIRLLFLPYDHENLINHLLKNEKEFNPLGNYNPEDFDEQIERLNAILEQEPVLPDYMVQFILDFYDEDITIDEKDFDKILAEGYYKYVFQTGNSFLHQWFEFEMNTKNILTANICRKYDRKIEDEIIGDNPMAADLKKLRSKSMGEIQTDDDYLNEIIRITEIDEFYNRELKQDQLKWNYLNEHTFFFYFTIEKVIGYLLKLFIVFRWKNLDSEEGKRIFEGMIREFQTAYELPEEFNLINR